MAKTNPGLTLKYLSVVFCIFAIVFATLYKRYDTFLLGIGIGLLAYGYKLDMTVVIFISALAVFLGSYLPFGTTSISVIQGFSEGFESTADVAEAEQIALNIVDNMDLKTYLDAQKENGRTVNQLIVDSDEWIYNRKMKKLQKRRADAIALEEEIISKQKEYIASENSSVPEYCSDLSGVMGRPSTDSLFRLYNATECQTIGTNAVGLGLSKVPSALQADGKCLWIQPDGQGGVELVKNSGPSLACARVNFPDQPPSFFDPTKGAKLDIVNRDFDPSEDDQGSYYSRYEQWHKGKDVKRPVDDDLAVKEGFENPSEAPKKKHLPPPDHGDRKEMFELGKKYELPKETDDPEYHLDAGTTFLNAYKSLKPDQLSAMSKDTMDLINTQKQLMTTLNTLKPLISDGKQMMDTFQNYFGGGSGGIGDLSKMADQFAPPK